MNKIFTVILLSIISVSCATKITDMDIARTEVTVSDLDGNSINTFLPDTVYRMDIRVTDTNDIEYQNPNYRNFRIGNLHKIKIQQQTAFSVRIKTPFETFHSAGTKAYGFSISIKNNTYPTLIYSYSLDWENYDTLDFRAKDGKDGVDGEDGSYAIGESVDTVTGGYGKDGTDGSRGYRGRNAELLVIKYNYGETDKLFFYDLNREQLFLTDIKPITIDTRGGNGGNGGSGGNGGKGTDYTDEATGVVIASGIPGSPGDGGNGGNGGRGGDLILFASDPSIFDYLRPLTAGGLGGQAGSRGKSLDNRGDKGEEGRNGWDGEVQFKVLELEEIELILNGINEEGFEKSRAIL